MSVRPRGRFGVGLLCAFVIAHGAAADENRVSEQQPDVKPGAAVRVITDADSILGTFVAVSQETVVVEVNGSPAHVPVTGIRRFSVSTSSHRRTTAIGIAVGALVGGAIGHFAKWDDALGPCFDCPPSTPPSTSERELTLAIVGAALGAGIAHFLPAQTMWRDVPLGSAK